MSGEERRRRADAQRNRQRLLDAAQELFRERGVEVGVGEIAERAGVGRGTLFRNFPTKEDLIAAIVVELMHEACRRGEALTEAPDPAAALFDFLDEIVGAQQLNRTLFEGVADTFLSNPEIRVAHAEVVAALGQLLARAQAAGIVRGDVGALDLLMMLKGVCEAASALGHADPSIVQRHLDLVRAALCASREPLRGRVPTLDDLDDVAPAPAAGERQKEPAPSAPTPAPVSLSTS